MPVPEAVLDRSALDRQVSSGDSLVILHKSASKIGTHRLCPRKLYGEKVEKFHVPEKRGVALGSDVHSLVELYLITHEIPSVEADIEWEQADRKKAVACSKALIPFFPDDKVPKEYIEAKVEIDLDDGSELIGYVDWTASSFC